jgi:chromosome segregation ATPase
MDKLLRDQYEAALATHSEKVAEITEQITTTQARVSAAKQEKADAIAQREMSAKRKQEVTATKNQAIANYDEPGENKAVAELKKIDKDVADIDKVLDRCAIRIAPETRFPQLADQLRFEQRACARLRFFLENADKINAALDAVRDVFNISETTRKDAEILLQDIPIFNSVNLDPRTGRPLQMRLKMPSVYDIEMQQHFHLFVESVKTEDGK